MIGITFRGGGGARRQRSDRVCSAVGDLLDWGEGGDEAVAQAGVGGDQQLVSGVQRGAAGDRGQLVLADDEADPGLLREAGELIDAVPVGRRALPRR
jgi:hypothetical protein